MGRKSGILLIVAGAMAFTPFFFALGSLTTFWLGDMPIEVAVEPSGYAFLAVALGLGLCLMMRGYSLYYSKAR